MNPLGKTGLDVMSIGFGGIVVMDSRPEQASKAVEDAIEFGINYFDVAPSYGNAEQMLGPAPEPFRKDIHLACKTHLRDAKGARETIDQSLKYLKTDYFDVFQLHAITLKTTTWKSSDFPLLSSSKSTTGAAPETEPAATPSICSCRSSE